MGPYWLYKQYAAKTIVAYWPYLLIGWISLAVVLRIFGPTWESVSRDGDLQFLPDDLPSRVGQRLLNQTFPSQGAKSQIVLIVANRKRDLSNSELALTFDLGRRLTRMGALSMIATHPSDAMSRAANLDGSEIEIDPNTQQTKSLLDSAIELDSQWFELLRAAAPQRTDLLRDRLTSAYQQRAILFDHLGDSDAAARDRQSMRILVSAAPNAPLPNTVGTEDDKPSIGNVSASKANRQDPSRLDGSDPNVDAFVYPWTSLRDVWTWEDPLLGKKLGAGNPKARMIVLQLENEFMAVSNRDLIEKLEELVSNLRRQYRSILSDDLEVGISGPAAVGADMVRAAATGVRQTEWISIVMVVAILALIYRKPILVAIPLLTVVVSLSISMSLIALVAIPSSMDSPTSWL